MSFFDKHVFICINQRSGCEDCCANHGTPALLGYFKDRVKAAGLAGPGKVRVSKAGCLGRCDDGPVMVIYPEAVWYTFVDTEDLDEILDSHLRQGRVVERLRV